MKQEYLFETQGEKEMKRIKISGMKVRGIALISFLILISLLLSVPPVNSQEVLNEDCSLNKDVFDRDWMKYSDLDERIPLESRSWEAQQYNATLSKIVDLEVQVFLLKRDREIDRLMRLELRDYKGRLVKNIKVNLLKSFWRLSYITYDTIKSAKGIGESYSKIFTSAESIKQLGAGLKVVRGLTPLNSTLAINTKETTGKVEAVGLTGALEVLESLGDPKSVGKAVFDETVKQILPSADLTPEEIEILRTQHLRNRLLDDALLESYKNNSERRRKVEGLEAQIKDLEQELAKWEAEEKNRVAESLVSACKERKREDEEESKTPTYLIWIDKYGNAGRIHVGTKEEFERPKKYRNEWLAGMSDEYLEKEMIGGPFESMDKATNKACDLITDPHYKNILGWGQVPYAKYGGKTYHIDNDIASICMP